MVQSNPKLNLPSTAELPCSDDTPVDNEDQNFIPNRLLFLLEYIWANRNDWFFAVDMGLYHTTGVNPSIPVIPDGFLSLGVERRKDGKSRLSYAVWEENEVVPILALEVVSKTPGDEYDKKLEIYQRLGILYYVIYNPQYWRRDSQQPFEVYKLINGVYQQQIGEPFWMPEIGLGIGRSPYVSGSVEREVLSWYDSGNARYPTPEEAANAAQQRANAAHQRAEQAELQVLEEREQKEKLATKLRELGIDPNSL